MKILYISRTKFGAMGEVALTNYVRRVSASHSVSVIEHPSAEAVVTPPPKGVRIHSLRPGPLRNRIHAVFDILHSTQPDIVHMIQSPYCYDYLMHLQPVFADTKWILDFRSPHVGAPDAQGLKKFQDMHLQVDLLLTHSRESLKTNIRRRWRPAIEIPPGVDFRKIATAGPTRLPPRDFVYVGSLSKTRKIEALIDGFDGYAHASTRRVRLDFVGTGNAEAALKDYVKSCGAEPHIRFLGAMEQSKLWRRLSSYDVGVAYVPLEHFGSAPSLKSLEYAAAGLPILASRTPGHISFAKKHGFHFTYFENVVPSFAKAAEDLATSRNIADIVEANRRAVRRLDWRRIIDERLIPAYERLVP